MGEKKKILVAILLAVGLLGAIAVGPRVSSVVTPEAQAQDTWTGHRESAKPFNGSTLGTASGSYPATICTGTTSKITTIKSMVITSVTAGVIDFRSAADNTGWSTGTSLGTFYFVANTPTQITEAMLGEGLKTTTAGHSIFASGPGTVYATFRVRVE